MKIKTIDIGSYSIKIIESFIEKKNIVHEKFLEIPTTDLATDRISADSGPSVGIDGSTGGILGSTTSASASTTISASIDGSSDVFASTNERIPLLLSNLQLQTLKNHLIPNNNIEEKIIWCLPSPNLTSRFLTLPVSNKKNAEKMIPFQLEKELPYSINDIHYGTQHFIQKGQTYTLISIADGNQFENYFKQLSDNKILPDYLSSELSVWQNFIEKRHLDGPALILDIGHETTKGYFIFNRKIVSSHLTYVGGKVIDENIAKYYQISLKEAVAYKHQHAFFLTEKQYQEVDNDQQEFAKLMKQIFSILIEDIHKWELGFRINNGTNVNNIYLTGGTSNIRNICNFFSQTLSIKTQLLESFDPSNFRKKYLNTNEKSSFTLAHLTGQSLISKNLPINFRHGKYIATTSAGPSLHSSAFIMVRILILFLIILLLLSIEKVFLLMQSQSLDKEISKLLQKPALKISRQDQKKYSKKPELILQKLQGRYKEINEEVAFLEKSMLKDGATSFLDLQKSLRPNPGWEISEFSSNYDSVKVKFLLLDEKDGLNNLREQLAQLQYKNLRIKEALSSKQVYLDFQL